MPEKPKTPFLLHSPTWYGVTALTSLLETTALHPLDTASKRLQINGTPFYSFRLNFSDNLKTIRQVLFKDTAKQNAFYKLASLYRGWPHAIAYKFFQRSLLTTQPQLKKALEATFQSQAYWVDLSSGIVIGGSQAFFLAYFDYFKTTAQTRKTAKPQENSKSIFTAFGPTVLRNIVFVTAMSISTDGVSNYLVENKLLASTTKPETEPNNRQKHLARFLGFGAATIASNPLDVIKTRLQDPENKSSKTAWQQTKEIWAKEGPTAFSKGVVIKTFSQSLRLTFFFGTQDYLLKKFAPGEVAAKTEPGAPNPWK